MTTEVTATLGGQWCTTLFFSRALTSREHRGVFIYMRRRYFPTRRDQRKNDIDAGLARRRERMRRKLRK